jgi:phage repressor protein C with HTH and peptisase S24 domain
MGIQERLVERLDAAELSQAALAQRVGVAQQTIWKLASGQSQNSRYLHKIARELGTTVEYLTGETDDPNAGAVTVLERSEGTRNPDPDLVQVEMIDLAYGMGGTFLDADSVEVEKVTFSRSWLRKFTQSPPQLLVSSQGMGDSMMPTIHDRDIVIIDRSNTRLDGEMGDKIWAIVFAGMGMIKRLRQMPDGTVKIMSDNQLVRDEIATDGDLHIVGRVVAKVSSL